MVLPNESSGIALSSSTCAPGWNSAVRPHARGPCLHSGLCMPLWSIVAPNVVPSLALSLHLMFSGMSISLAYVAALQCAFGLRVPSSGALQVLPVPGPPSDLSTFCVSLLRVHHSAASNCAMVRMIFDRVRCACPCTCSAGKCASLIVPQDPLRRSQFMSCIVGELDFAVVIDFHTCMLQVCSCFLCLFAVWFVP